MLVMSWEAPVVVNQIMMVHHVYVHQKYIERCDLKWTLSDTVEEQINQLLRWGNWKFEFGLQ